MIIFDASSLNVNIFIGFAKYFTEFFFKNTALSRVIVPRINRNLLFKAGYLFTASL